MMGGGPGRGVGAMIPRPLLGPHLTGSGGSVSAQSGSETDVSTSTENLTQVGPDFNLVNLPNLITIWSLGLTSYICDHRYMDLSG